MSSINLTKLIWIFYSIAAFSNFVQAVPEQEIDDWGSWEDIADQEVKTKRWTREGLCDHDALTSVLLKILLDIQDSMKTGDPSIGVPPLDPLKIPNFEFEVTGTKHKFGIKGDLMNVVVMDMSKFTILDIQSDITEMEANVTLEISAMTIFGSYKLRGLVLSPMPLPIFGNGKFLLGPKHVKIHIFSKFGYSDGLLELLYFDFDVKPKDIFVKFDGILGVGPQITAIVNSLGLKVFNKLEPKIHQKVRNRGVNGINKILVDLKYDEAYVMEMLQIPLRCMFG